MLYGGSVKGTEVSEWANTSTWPNWVKDTRTWKDFATTPHQQANIINLLSEYSGIPLKAEAKHGSKADLLQLLATPDTVVIVTIGWDSNFTPFLARDSDTATGAGQAPWHYYAHALILAAYDSGHTNTATGTKAEWGFVNSWTAKGSEIYWMPDADFDKAWNFNVTPVGSNNMVVVTK
jgi:hypothetical protein